MNTGLSRKLLPVREKINCNGTITKCFPLALSSQDQAWYSLLTSNLTPEQAKALQEVVVTADQRKAAKESKLIEKQGGFNFPQTTVPTTFNFGS